LAHHEPLKLPVTEWQETARLAAALVDDPAGFIEPLARVNLPLAGRCAAQPGVLLDESRRWALAERLIERSRHPEADLRARFAAGLALGELGDTRLESHQGAHGDYLLSSRITVPGKVYSLGSDEGEGNSDEARRFSIRIDDFELAQCPVTNAEWRCFMAAGGYENADWWETEDARAWRLGTLSMEQEKSGYRDIRLRLQRDFEEATAGFTPTAVEQVQSWVDADDETFETWLSGWFPEGEPVPEPLFWRDPQFNNPAQPVVGICWYEARAYCRWLSEQAGRRFSLPGEAQWEAACRGSGRREYAWEGDYDPMKANVYDTHLRTTTPVGMFPEGDTPEGLMDMTGNVWEWTRDRYEGYPIQSDDGRDEATGRHRRVLRGGAFFSFRRSVRAAYRNYDGSVPADRLSFVGFRVSCELSPIVKSDR
ncbi:MAG: SUMF1/EgtB/PvdO family nonheme iron enzyme, partial [Pseudomonadota bacterium]|nr:SUMF1/EgtB/PvdO family nonheme iron enzyme [Pseudomonadota bacterium]